MKTNEEIKNSIEKNLEELKKFTSTHGNGCTRLPFTKETRDAAEYLKNIMRDAKLEVKEDSAGNIIGIRKGKDSSKPAIVTGSHYDSVYNGGNYDGIAGVVVAIEIAKILEKENIQLEKDYIVVAFMDEEGTRFGTGYFGSKSILGDITVSECKHYLDKDGISIYEAMKNYGLNPEKILQAKWPEDRIGEFFELHIEQGPVLDKKGMDLGLVDGIVGIQRYIYKVVGRADHAGTTPMDMRQDAVEIATKAICKIPDLAREINDGTVATSGYINVTPGGINIVAQEVEFSVDIRSMNISSIEQVKNNIEKILNKETEKYGATWSKDTKLIVNPIKLDDKMLDILEESSKKRGYTYKRMPSGAGHDSLAIGQKYRTVMLFVPSVEGRSHSPNEYTPYEYFAGAAEVLFDLVIKLGSN